MKKILFIACVLFSSISLFAQQRSEHEALQIAKEFFGNFGKKGKVPQLSMVADKKVNSMIRRKVVSDQKTTASPSSFYVVNDKSNNCFVIVSADERLNTILGYSDNGCFDLESVPEALLSILFNYDRQYNYLLSSNYSFAKEQQARKTAVEAIEPMITTKWGQMTPFNAECPKDPDHGDGSLCATGCIATAMAQIINYHKYPAKGKGNYLYISDTHSFIGYMNYDNYTINYENLIDDLNSATDEQKAEVAKLMYACGVSIGMDYCADGSGSMDYNVPYAFINFFGYNPNTVYRNKDYYTWEEWNDIIMQDLKAGRPILYNGYNESHQGGHSFVLDGCDKDGLYHFNFGSTQDISGFLWPAPGDGYYQLNAVKQTFMGLEMGDFSYYQSMVCNISPTTVGEHEDTFYGSLFNLTQAGLSNEVYYSIVTQCYSSDANEKAIYDEKFSGEIGIGLFDMDYNYLGSMYSEPITCNSAYAYIKAVQLVTLDTSGMEEGKDYIIAPYAKSKNAAKGSFMRCKLAADIESDEYRCNRYCYYEGFTLLGFLVLSQKTVNDVCPGVGIIQADLKNDNSWYTLHGVRLDSKPTKPGIYLYQGRKIVLK